MVILISLVILFLLIVWMLIGWSIIGRHLGHLLTNTCSVSGPMSASVEFELTSFLYVIEIGAPPLSFFERIFLCLRNWEILLSCSGSFYFPENSIINWTLGSITSNLLGVNSHSPLDWFVHDVRVVANLKVLCLLKYECVITIWLFCISRSLYAFNISGLISARYSWLN